MDWFWQWSLPARIAWTISSHVSAPRLCKLKREIEAAGVFRRGEPPAGFAAPCGQIQKNLLRVVTGLLLGDRPERRDAC